MQPYERQPKDGQVAAPATPDRPGLHDTTEGTLLAGKVTYRQFRSGYRTGLEPVLMAAFVPARPADQVIEAGCGAGAGLLCLATRVPCITGIGIEADPATAELARTNLARNGRQEFAVLQSDIASRSLPIQLQTLLAHRPGPPKFDHAFANPPWHRPDGTPSPEPRRDQARRARPDTIPSWIGALASLVRPKGSLTLALPAELLAPALAAFEEHGVGSADILPLWPAIGRECRIVLVRGRLLGRAGSRLLPGLVLHEADGTFTPQAQHILRDGEALFPESFRSTARLRATAPAPENSSR